MKYSRSIITVLFYFKLKKFSKTEICLGAEDKHPCSRLIMHALDMQSVKLCNWKAKLGFSNELHNTNWKMKKCISQ